MTYRKGSVVLNTQPGPYFQVEGIVMKRLDDTNFSVLMVSNSHEVVCDSRYLKKAKLTRGQRNDAMIGAECLRVASKNHHRVSSADKCTDGELNCEGCPWDFWGP